MATVSTAVAVQKPVGVLRFLMRSETEEAASWNRMCMVAQAFSESDLVPEQFRGKPENCLIAGQLSKRMDVDLFMLMQNMYVVHGKPGIEAKFAIAMCNAKRVFNGPIRYELTGNGPTRSCRAHATDRESGHEVEAVCDMAMANAEGWTSKSGSKWKTLPDLMLQYRSAMFLIRLNCPEVLMGMQSVDELVDVDGPLSGNKVATSSLNDAVDRLIPQQPATSQPNDEPEQDPEQEFTGLHFHDHENGTSYKHRVLPVIDSATSLDQLRIIYRHVDEAHTAGKITDRQHVALLEAVNVRKTEFTEAEPAPAATPEPTPAKSELPFTPNEEPSYKPPFMWRPNEHPDDYQARLMGKVSEAQDMETLKLIMAAAEAAVDDKYILSEHYNAMVQACNEKAQEVASVGH